MEVVGLREPAGWSQWNAVDEERRRRQSERVTPEEKGVGCREEACVAGTKSSLDLRAKAVDGELEAAAETDHPGFCGGTLTPIN